MRRRTVLIGASAIGGAAVLAAGGIGWGFASAGPAPQPQVLRPPERLTAAEMRADVAAFANAVVEVGGDPFRTCPRPRFDRVRAEVEAECAEPRATEMFAVSMLRLAATLNDGHVSIWNTPYSWRWKDGATVFPVLLRIDTDGTLIAGDGAVPSVPAGSRIVAVDGRSAEDLVAQTIVLTGGQTPALRRAFARMGERLYALDGARSRHDVRFVTPSGRERTVRLDAVPAKTFLARRTARPADYVVRMTADRIAVIDYNHCRNAPAFAAFLQSAFTRVRDERARAVVVDIRANGGGAESVNRELWPYLSDRPFGTNTGMRCRSSARLKHEYGPFRYVKVYDVKAFFAADGTLVDYPPEHHVEQPRPTPLRTTVPVFMLIGPQTFSSALACALTASDSHLATLVGEETAEPVNGTGETYSFALPNSCMCATVTTKLYYTPPHPDGRGVPVDIKAPRTARDAAIGKDPALDAVRARLS